MPSRALVVTLIGFLCLVWGTTWIVIKGGLADLPPLTSAAARFWVAGGLMVPVAWVLRDREQGADPPAWIWGTVGSVSFAASYAIVYWTETRLPSGLVAVLWAVSPLMMATGTALFLKQTRLGPKQWFGLALGFLGVVALFWTDVSTFGSRGLWAGAILLLSPFVSTAGTTVVKRWGEGYRSLPLNRNAMLLCAAVLSVAALAVESSAPVRWTPAALGSVAYLGIAGTVMTFSVYFWLLRFVDAHKLSLIAYITPAIALTLGTLVGDEPFRWTTLVGAGLVLTGVAAVAGK